MLGGIGNDRRCHPGDGGCARNGDTGDRSAVTPAHRRADIAAARDLWCGQRQAGHLAGAAQIADQTDVVVERQGEGEIGNRVLRLTVQFGRPEHRDIPAIAIGHGGDIEIGRQHELSAGDV